MVQHNERCIREFSVIKECMRLQRTTMYLTMYCYACYMQNIYVYKNYYACYMQNIYVYKNSCAF